MKRLIGYLLIAIFGNALGTALMEQTNIGMTAWGSSALNVSNYLDVSLGTGFIILSVFFYSVAIVLARKIILKQGLYSALFLVSYAYLTDLFLFVIPSFESYPYIFRIIINLFGLLILLFSIAVHLRINFAVHPMDVFLKEMQSKMKSIALGTYASYLIGFSVGICFGLLYGSIEGIGLGTLFTLTLSGITLKLYNKYILDYWHWTSEENVDDVH